MKVRLHVAWWNKETEKEDKKEWLQKTTTGLNQLDKTKNLQRGKERSDMIL